MPYAWERAEMISSEPLGRGWSLDYWISYDGRFHAVIVHVETGNASGTAFPKSTKDEARAEVEQHFMRIQGWLPWSVTLAEAERVLRERAPGHDDAFYAEAIARVFPAG